MSLQTLQRPAPEVPLNLLPPQIQAEQRSRRIFAIAAIGVGALLLLLIVILVVLRMRIGNAEETLRRSQAEVATLQGEVSALRQFDTLKISVDQSRATLASALTADIEWSRFLDNLDTNIPANSRLTSLTMAAAAGATPDGAPSLGTVQYAGVVGTFPGLAGWLDTMSAVDGLRFVYLGTGTKSEETVTFNATAHLTESMLSGRCQQETSPCP